MRFMNLIQFAISESEVDIPKPELNSGTLEIIFRIALSIAGAIALFYITLGGFRYTISSGDPQAVARAKNQILYGIIGLVVSVSAQVLIGYILQRLP